MSRIVLCAALSLTFVSSVAAEPPSAAATTPPRITGALRPGSSSYQGEMTGGGQGGSISATQTVRHTNGTWIVEAISDTPLGVVTDTTVLDATTGELRRRTVKEGPMLLDLAFAGGQAKGTLTVAKRAPKPVSIDVGGEVLGDGAGGYDVLALLPLAEGYKASYRTLDELMQQAVTRQIAVVGSEQVTVPAGTFAAWKAEISSDQLPGRVTLWVAKDSHKVLKTLTTQPWMGGLRISLELQK